MQHLLNSKSDRPDELEDHETKPKTYILESNIGSGTFLDRLDIRTSNPDTDLYILHYKQIKIVIDIESERFWYLHILGSAEKGEDFIDEYVETERSQLDRVWLSSTFLKGEVGNYGDKVSFGLKYKDVLEDMSHARRISMQLWNGPIDNILSTMPQMEGMENSVSLSKIGIDFNTETMDIRSDINYQGKIRIRKGSHIEPYFTMLSKIKDSYKNTLEIIESTYRPHNDSEESPYLRVDFERNISRPEVLMEALIDGTKPFKIVGNLRRDSLDKAYARCVDLHTADPFSLEILPNSMRIYLNKDSCGNVALRLFSNLQINFDAEAKLKGSEHDQLL
jgi:hypothetical protein